MLGKISAVIISGFVLTALIDKQVDPKKKGDTRWSVLEYKISSDTEMMIPEQIPTFPKDKLHDFSLCVGQHYTLTFMRLFSGDFDRLHSIKEKYAIAVYNRSFSKCFTELKEKTEGV